MSELISDIELKKADGAPINFNFQFENGLPIKPLLNVKREVWINEESLYGITVMIEEENKKYINSFDIKEVSYHDTDNKNIKTIWIHLENCYLVISNINNDLLNKMIERKLLFTFVDSEKKQLN